VVEVLLAAGVAAAKVADGHDVLRNPQLAYRGFWDEFETEHGPARAPGNPVAAPVAIAWAAEGARPSTGARLAAARNDALPLAGTLVVDFTAFWAGPSATRLLADLGARVIWVERPYSRREPDGTFDSTEEVMHYFHLKMNRNKESVVLDLGTTEGREIARRLAAVADVVVENFRPGVMDGMGLGAAELCAANPTLVYVSLSGFGSTGPWSDRRSYGPTIEAASSIEGRTGYDDGEPLRLGHTLPDGAGGLAGALAALRGLRERDARGGTGGWFDVSQLEAYVALSGEELLVASMSDEPLARLGNRSRSGAVQGVFPCAGDDAWVAIRVANERDLQRLADVADQPALVSTALAVPRDDDAVEAMIGAFTRGLDKHEAARRLQAVGLESFAVLTPAELVDDAHLDARGFFLDVPYDDRLLRLPGSPLHGLADPGGRAPRFGEHTRAVLEALELIER
jgi:crotonobetainyl-CoA:carnitine CoA-transferase CaiB-like acyl-CoA transferase